MVRKTAPVWNYTLSIKSKLKYFSYLSVAYNLARKLNYDCQPQIKQQI